jgi:acyl-CoA synthetase (AMP-forming)/AMP-acid ligase II
VWFEPGERTMDFEYHKDAAKTASTRDDHGWSSVGDIGYLDDDGYLYLTDRRDFMIVSGGVNIYPQEAENLLITHPKVMDAAVFGIPDEEMGQRVHAVIQPVDFADAGPELERELLAFCRDNLAHYKCPRAIDFDPELPRQPTGKLYKRLLRDRYWGDSQSRIV